jgi:hypothetical protein
MAWTLKGEAGAALDATARSLAELNISGCQLRFQSLAGDRLTWTAETTDATGAGTIVPDIGQVVELWRDSVRKFRGHVTAPKVGMRKIEITAEGPWWWLERLALTGSALDGNGTSAERAAYVFATGSLKTHLETLIDLAIAAGAPMTRGTVADCYDVPKTTLSDLNCGNALATLLAWVPDAVAWFDHSAAGLPALHVTRRGGATETTYTLGTDAVENCEITPRLDLEVAQVDLNYVTRTATTGKPAWASQAGVIGTPAAGQRQIVTVSGPEIVTALPKDDFDVATIQTAPVLLMPAEFYLFDPAIKAAIDNYGSNINWNYCGSSYGTFTNRPSMAAGYATGWHRVIAGEMEEFMKKDLGRDGSGTLIPGVTATDLRVQGWVYNNVSGVGWGAAGSALINQGRAVGGILSGQTVFAVYVDYTLPVINHSFPTLTTVYKAWDYDYLHPPAGLADNLAAAQNWVPWEGPLTLVADDVSGDNLLPRKYRLANCLPPCAIMDALARGVTHDLMRGRTTIDLGAPARVDFGTLVGRVRTEPQDNIVYL